jgi:hypothetical protein
VGLGTRGGSCCNLIPTGEPVEDRSAVDLMVGQVDRWWGLVFGLGWCELPECPVWPCGVEVLQIDGQDPAQVTFVDVQDPVE